LGKRGWIFGFAIAILLGQGNKKAQIGICASEYSHAIPLKHLDDDGDDGSSS